MILIIETMGGFILIGQNYIIKNTSPGYDCLCPPFLARLDEKTENMLVQNTTKTLVLSELPTDLALKFVEAGADNEGMNYYVKPNKHKEHYNIMNIDHLDHVFNRSILD